MRAGSRQKRKGQKKTAAAAHRQLPELQPVPTEQTTVVASPRGVRRAARILLGSQVAARIFGGTDASALASAGGAGAVAVRARAGTGTSTAAYVPTPDVVGIDVEWPPPDGPAAVLQLATRGRAFIFDLQALLDEPNGSGDLRAAAGRDGARRT